jgi:multicomponent K+:H+ antiporter subunit G
MDTSMLETLPFWLELIICFFIVLGACFAFIGSFGLLRLPDFMTRLHAPTKNTTMGVGGVIIGSLIYFAATTGFNIHELLIAIFLFLTAPISAHLLAKAGMHRQLKLTPNTRDLRKQPEQFSDEQH